MPKSRISIVAAKGTWVVRADGAVIGESERAVAVAEEGGAAVVYFPREDLAMAFLEPGARVVASPGLGEARFFSVLTPDLTLQDAAWSYEAPAQGAHRLAGLVAFDRSRVTVEEV
jgi:uncharacterized protein (DUF427 family)